MSVRNIFHDGIILHDGTSYRPALSSQNDRLSGLSWSNDNTLALSSRGISVVKVNYNYVEFMKNLRIPINAVNNATLTSDASGNSSWRISKLSGAFKWNSLYLNLDTTKQNNQIDISFSSTLSNPAITLSKESDFAIANLDLYLKNKTNNGFKLYSNSLMSKQIHNTETGEYSSVVLANNGVGVVFYDTDLDRMVYTYSDSTYETFSTPINIDDISSIGICSMTIVNGNPAVVYISDEGTNDKWKYVRATDATGTAWGTPVVLLTSTVDVTFLANTLFLMIIDGNPAVFLNDETGRAKIIKSSDADGVTWAASVNISNLSNHQILDVTLIEDKPAVIAKSNTTSFVYYVQSTNIAGSSWPIAATQIYKTGHVALVANMGRNNNVLTLINSDVCIITTENTTNSIYIAYANDINGATWNDSSLLAETNTSNTFPQVFVNNNITYMLHNNYTGSPSTKILTEFGTVNTSSVFIQSLNNCMNHQILPNKKDNNNNIILSSEQGLTLLKFYGNDFVINWIAV